MRDESQKKAARYEWERINSPDWHVLGFTFDEKKRAESFMATERSNLLAVLVDEQITKQNCFDIIKDAGIKRPEIYELGYPNANCIGCVKATSPTYWNLVRKTFPDIFNARAEQSRRIGARLTRLNGKRIFLDELRPTDNARKIKSWDCGVFCEGEK